jgi:uncharacterized protein YkwD
MKLQFSKAFLLAVLVFLPSALWAGDDILKASWTRPIGQLLSDPGVSKPNPVWMTLDDYRQGAPVGGLKVGTFSQTHRGDFARWRMKAGVHNCQPALSNVSAMYQRTVGVTEGVVQVLVVSPPRSQAQINVRGTERRVFEEVNRVRRAQGLERLEWNERLAQEARRQALNMAARRFFAHRDPVRGDIAERLNASHIEWRNCAENLSQERGYDDPVAVAVQGWLESPGHRKNMLDKVMTQTGVGVAIEGLDTVLIVQDFIRPPDAPPRRSR